MTTTLIPAAALQAGGEANGRALAYLAHRDFGDCSARVYDLATIAILWFAGSSAMAGPAEPRAALPAALRHGAGLGARDASARRVITAIGFVVTIAFEADVDAQGGAYATGVLC